MDPLLKNNHDVIKIREKLIHIFSNEFKILNSQLPDNYLRVFLIIYSVRQKMIINKTWSCAQENAFLKIVRDYPELKEVCNLILS